MALFNEIEILSDQIRQEFNPDKIILFGSHAWGKPDSDSDVDILVVLPCIGKPWALAARIREQIKPTVPLDLLVRTPEQLKTRLEQNDSFLTKILNDGKVLYES